jgi:Arc/MetJ family transcription regulator
MKKRTSLNLDLDLVAEAKEVLETTETTETVHRALNEVVRQARLRRLAQRRIAMSDRELAQLRRPRSAGSGRVSTKAKATA